MNNAIDKPLRIYVVPDDATDLDKKQECMVAAIGDGGLLICRQDFNDFYVGVIAACKLAEMHGLMEVLVSNGQINTHTVDVHACLANVERAIAEYEAPNFQI